MYRRYAASLPNSLGWILSNTFAFSARGTCVGYKYGRLAPSPIPFSVARGIARSLHTQTYWRIRAILVMTTLLALQRLNSTTMLLGLSKGVWNRFYERQPAQEY